MTQPMTPREKVEHHVKEAVLAASVDVPAKFAKRVEMRKMISASTTDAILAALASGSGDHAELARLAEAVLHDPQYDGHSFAAAANPAAVLALIAEIAALTDALERAGQYQTQFRNRATEAERKLAEARGLLEPFSEAAENLDDDTRDHDHIWELPAAMTIDAGHLRVARTFLSSTEAERG